MQQIFMSIHVLAAIFLIGLVLIQHGRGADAGAAFGSGSSGTLFGARGPATFLSRATMVLAVVFFLTSLSLAYIAAHSTKRESVIERLGKQPVEHSRAVNTSDGLSTQGAGSSMNSRDGADFDIPDAPDASVPAPVTQTPMASGEKAITRGSSDRQGSRKSTEGEP